MDCTIYFSSWGLIRLKKKGYSLSLARRAFPMGLLMRGGLDGGPISRYNFFGLGRLIFKVLTRRSDVGDIHGLMEDYRSLGGRVVACEYSMDIMGFEKGDMDESLVDEYGAIGPYIREGLEADLTVVI
ncbi:MAG: hypothetical protein GWN86_18265 [Desulfobacterales bacterium]|nr:hypothetical protein [Desulfobacterales bacterium]